MLPPTVSITKHEKGDVNSPDGPLPPIITRTAATPQGSPCATLEPYTRLGCDNNRLEVPGGQGFPVNNLSLESLDRSVSKTGIILKCQSIVIYKGSFSIFSILASESTLFQDHFPLSPNEKYKNVDIFL